MSELTQKAVGIVRNMVTMQRQATHGQLHDMATAESNGNMDNSAYGLIYVNARATTVRVTWPGRGGRGPPGPAGPEVAGYSNTGLS